MSIMRSAVVDGERVESWGHAYGVEEGIWDVGIVI